LHNYFLIITKFSNLLFDSNLTFGRFIQPLIFIKLKKVCKVKKFFGDFFMSNKTAANTPQALSESTQNAVQNFNQLSTDDQLAALYYVYEKMGSSITPAAPTAAEPEVAPLLLADFYELSSDEQLQIMRDIVSGKDTEYSHAYGALSANNQLVVWYTWATSMGETVVDMPNDYERSEQLNNVVNQIEKLEFEEQISVLREVAENMGYSQVQRATQQGVTPSL
jgi:hypothetical protein